MKNKINFSKIVDVLEKGVQIRTMSTYAQFALQLLGYQFYNDGEEVFKYQLFEMGYDNVEKLLSDEYPITVKERIYDESN